jgi:predicted ATPase/class 3 adenylate cyclase/tRNA A-37 threonylcarbamoyl transferase component Bud32
MTINPTIAIAGYQIFAQIHESANSLVYRGLREQDKAAVILKILKQDYPTPQELTRYKREYEMTRNLNIDGVVKAYDLQSYQKTLVIVLEDFGASSLKQLIQKENSHETLSLTEFLKIAIQTAKILGQIHSSNVIHKDINPTNIVFNPKTGQIKIIDFGTSSQLTRESPTLRNPNVLEGTLAYMSPEQTGRMNRSLDYRTDFYSLGVTFYELLTGKLPFETTDALELVHFHIAKQPVPPHLLGRGAEAIPQAVSDIVMKLMAKMAEERYQSAWGIVADLQACLFQLESTGTIEVFPLGTQDISERFQIPQKLYGREAEVETLLAAFERVAGGKSSPQSLPNKGTAADSHPLQGEGKGIELMLVTGYSGIGKSALVAEIHKPITEKRGYFISGKFDQFQRNIPYSAIVTAFQGLVRQLLTESEVEIAQWQEKILAALGANAQLIVEVIPEVELIVGKQPPVPELGISESQNRFNRVFQNFIRAFCTKEHPLVIFLDDLQWADSATLKLIQLMMMDPDSQYLFLIGAYRDNEVSLAHPLVMMLDGLRQEGATINQITLASLALESISQLIADTLHSDIAFVKPLAELVMRKTEGNPFFVNEFLKTLYAENLLTFIPPHPSLNRDGSTGGFWQWDIANIEAKNITDNVVDLTIGKINKLPESAQTVLRLAACVGAYFDLNTLSIISEKTSTESFKTLTPALHSGLILPLSEVDENLLIQDYKFLHDRVQQAAYTSMNEEKQKDIHLQIGRLLLQHTPSALLGEKIFEITDRFNLGCERITQQRERDKLTELNLRAGQKAMAAMAYESAFNYLRAGLKGLEAGSWQTNYHLTLSLHSLAAKAACLSGNWQQQAELTRVVLQQARTILDAVNVYDVQLQACMAQNQQVEAWETARTVLQRLGVEFPDNPNQDNIQQALNETAASLAGKTPMDLLDLPAMTQPDKLAIVKILSSVFSAAFQANPKIFPLIVCKQIDLCVNYGNTPMSAFTYATYGLILCGIVGDVQMGYQFGKLALNLLNQANAKEVRTRTMQIVYSFLHHWREPVSTTLNPLWDAYHQGLETGDLEYAAYCLAVYCLHSFFIGTELSELEKTMATCTDAIVQLKKETALNYHQVYQQLVLNLIGKASNPRLLVGEAYNEKEMLPVHQQANDKTALFYYYFNKSFLDYLFEDNSRAAENIDQSEQYLEGITATLNIPLFYFYDSLIALADCDDNLQDNYNKILLKVSANQEKLKKWACDAPMNFRHKFELVEAERCRVAGQKLEAIDGYDKAIALAKENAYLNEAALANELAAKFYLKWGKHNIAQLYLTEARYSYLRWGATAKVEDLDAKYPQLLPQPSPTKSFHSLNTTTSNSTSGSQSGEALDFATVMKASQVISGEIVLDKLLAKLMKISVENAGAQSGYLILETAGQLLIEASGEIDTERISVLQSIPIESIEAHGSTILPVSIVNYVARTSESVVLNDATNEGNFTNDPYIKQHQPQSILCVPLLNQGKLISIIYLENNLTAGAFTPERLEVLKLLSAQAAISIENAKLYTAVRDNESRLVQLNQAFSRFVPSQFLQFLDKASIVDVKAGDSVQKEMSVLFADIRDFTSLSEQMTPEENFKFINSYLYRMEPIIIKHQGFIDKYMGDGIMALFGGIADDAVKAGITMLQSLLEYNQHRLQSGYVPIHVGIGINTGSLMLGTVGGDNRMDSTVISDAVNLAARLEGLTKYYGVSLLISGQTVARLHNPMAYHIRFVDRVKVKGKSKLVAVFEVFDGDERSVRESKSSTKTLFERGVFLYHQQARQQAARHFERVCTLNPRDTVAQIYLDRCHSPHLKPSDDDS